MSFDIATAEEDPAICSAGVADSDLPLLVIEDEDSVQTFLRAALKKHGYETVMASSGKEALNFLQAQSFRGVISDMCMPGEINGADIHAWISVHRPQLLSRMLFITGDLSGEDAAEVLGKTGVACMAKPFRVHELIRAVQRVLES